MNKKNVITTLLMLVFLLATNAQEQPAKKSAAVTFSVGMHCAACKARIEKNISWEKGVKDLSVDLEAKTVYIKFDPRKTSVEALKQAIENLGYSTKILTQKE